MSRLALWLCCVSSFAAPAITRVEPPNWWAGQAYTQIRLLVQGTELKDAEVSASRGLEIIESKSNDAGTYLFVEAKVHRAGSFELKVKTKGGSAQAPFEVLTPMAKAGRFQGFSPKDLIYMIMPDRFSDGDPSNNKDADKANPTSYHGGDLQGIINQLGYLKDLGVTAIWLTPVCENGIAYHGYHAVDFYAIEPRFGTMAKFSELVEKAHQSGIKVILDMVMNHTGPAHPWVKNPPLPDWFHGTPEHHLNETYQIWTLLDPHAGPAMRAPVLDGWFANQLPDLNQEEPEVARYLIQNTLWWIASTGIDGIRADTLPYVPRQFWHDWSAAIKKEYPNFRVVGEVFDGDPGVVSFFQGGDAGFDGIDTGIDTLFDFPLYGALRRAFAEAKPVPELAYITAHDSLYRDSKDLVTFLGNHDVQRFMSDQGATLAGLKLAFTYLFTTRGIPMIYYGDELAMRGGADPDNRHDFPGEPKTDEERQMLDYVRKLAHLRQSTPELQTGKLTQVGVSKDAYVFRRGELIVMINNGAQPVKVEAEAAPGTWKDLLDNVGNIPVHEHSITVTVPPRSAAIMKQR